MHKKMGLDVGDKTIGVALSDMMGITAQPLKTIRRKNYEKDFDELIQIIKSNSVDEIISGLPKNMNGTLGPQGEKVIKFIEKLQGVIDIKVEYWDERLTTVAAQRALLEADMSREKRKK
ncbi:putative holliday junction resolvase [Peptoclostridium acidaminophilum DSM 3953]|uniref:Putative pre-16S rRNA nuclease n=1 Tax=Peptoclostridium acidaminophilum DSM 3953 TaxID=1286171 RepID=W8T6P4_PEPAC|nr:Holliday junction resolvase RuvX [Peptoclostridium acidaminophilum]AHM56550.1 putative holliday junction resolvase [Peptoclostridium acidaminophilum DSM 3953]